MNFFNKPKKSLGQNFLKDKNLSVILKNKFDKDIEIINDNILNYNQDIYHN